MRKHTQSIPRVQIRLDFDKALKEAYIKRNKQHTENINNLRQQNLRQKNIKLKQQKFGLKLSENFSNFAVQIDQCGQKYQSPEIPNQLVMRYVEQIYKCYPIKDYSKQTYEQNKQANEGVQENDKQLNFNLNDMKNDPNNLMLSTMRTLPSRNQNKLIYSSTPKEIFNTGKKGREGMQTSKANDYINRRNTYKPESSPSKSISFHHLYSSLKSSINQKEKNPKPSFNNFDTPKRILLKTNFKNCCSTKSQIVQDSSYRNFGKTSQLKKINQISQISKNNCMHQIIKSTNSVKGKNKQITKFYSSRLNSEQYDLFTQKKYQKPKIEAQVNQHRYRYCLICQQPILQVIINDHQKNCQGFSQIYKKSIAEIRNLIQSKISQIKARIQKKLASTEREKYQKIKGIYDLTQKICQGQRYLQKDRKWEQLKERDYIQLMRKGSIFMCILDDVGKLRWFSKMIENIDKIQAEEIDADNFAQNL